MKLFKCIKSSNEFMVEVTKGKIYECEKLEGGLITVVDDFYVRRGVDMEKFKELEYHCKLPEIYFNEIFEEVR